MLHSILANTDKTFWMPQGASSVSNQVDNLFYLVYWVSVFFFVLVVALMLLFVFKYRHRKGQVRESYAGHSTALELTWTIIPTIIVIVIFYFGFRTYLALAVEPPNAYEITVNAKMWSWSFIYPNGLVSNELHIPANTPVRFVLTSDDVIHSLYIPDFRIKKDVVPGRYNRLWVEAYRANPDPKAPPEKHEIECAEYCGMNHSAMLSTAWVHDPEEFKHWLEGASTFEGKMSWVDAGKQIYQQRGCSQCHSTEAGVILTGPSWRDMYGSTVPLSTGQSVKADEAYIRESILYPQAKIHKGFGPVMPSFLGTMKERDINALIAFMKSISTHYSGDKATLTQIAQPTPGSGTTAK